MNTSIKKSIIKFTLKKNYKNTSNNMNLNHLIDLLAPTQQLTTKTKIIIMIYCLQVLKTIT